jgi:hypothetical protein
LCAPFVCFLCVYRHPGVCFVFVVVVVDVFGIETGW